MFFLKKAIAPLLYPVPLTIELLLLGIFLLWFTSRQKLGKVLLTLGTVLLLIFSNTFITDWLSISLEHRFMPLLQQPPAVRWVVVLGGGNSGNDRFPANAKLSTGSMMRLIEGIRLYRKIPGSKLLLSGGSVFGSLPDGQVMGQVAEAIGVPSKDIVLEADARDTEEEARIIHGMIHRDRFILVTSASHMPRSVSLFRKYGMDPIPAPSDFLAKPDSTISPTRLYPNAGSIGKAEKAFHEYLGLGWGQITSKR
jgi:uncharacterized SAM-binding protein YcdF (DUF218 family)